MPQRARFVFMTCQVGAENALKVEMARDWPGLRFAYSRPGFLTFKHSTGAEFDDEFHTHSVFARSCGVSLGKITEGTQEERVTRVWEMLDGRDIAEVHVFPRDQFTPGFKDYEPSVTPEAVAIREAIVSSSLATEKIRQQVPVPSPDPKTGPFIADVILVEPNEWWIGCHRARRAVSGWPGGLYPVELPDYAVSRVYLKMREAIAWSGFKFLPGQRAMEIGCSPGGSSQALLEMGLDVVGVDPAGVDPALKANPRFRHIQKKSKDVPRREFLRIDWLTCDVNMPPNYTLDAVEAIIKYPGVRLKGVILTLKLPEWELANSIPEYVTRITKWGFKQVRPRQLHHNRQEICIVAK